MDSLAIRYNKIIKSYDEETKLFQQILMKMKQPVKCILSIFHLNFCLLL